VLVWPGAATVKTRDGLCALGFTLTLFFLRVQFGLVLRRCERALERATGCERLRVNPNCRSGVRVRVKGQG